MIVYIRIIPLALSLPPIRGCRELWNYEAKFYFIFARNPLAFWKVVYVNDPPGAHLAQWLILRSITPQLGTDVYVRVCAENRSISGRKST